MTLVPRTPHLAERLRKRAWQSEADCAAVIGELCRLFSAARVAALTKIHPSTISEIKSRKAKATMEQEQRLLDLRGRLLRAGLL
jgi:hypothetical protein